MGASAPITVDFLYMGNGLSPPENGKVEPIPCCNRGIKTGIAPKEYPKNKNREEGKC